MPSALSRVMTSQSDRRACGSSPVVGSSREHDGRVVDQRDRNRQPLPLPAGKVAARVVGFFLQVDRGDELIDRQRAREERAEQREQLPRGELFKECRGLELHADAFLHPARFPAHVDAEDLDPATIGRAQALDHLDGGALARAVGSEQAEDLPRLDPETHAIHGAGGAVGFDEIGDFDGERHGRGEPRHCMEPSANASGLNSPPAVPPPWPVRQPCTRRPPGP